MSATLLTTILSYPILSEYRHTILSISQTGYDRYRSYYYHYYIICDILPQPQQQTLS